MFGSVRIILFTFLVLICLPNPVCAQLEGEFTYSEGDKIGFAFYSLSGIQPDFYEWVKNTDKYKNAGPTGKVQLYNQDVYRLQNGYANFNPQEDLITLEFKNAHIKAEPFYTESRYHDNLTSVFVTLPDFPGGYFPFPVADKWVALIIKDFDVMREILLGDEEFKSLAAKTGHRHIAYQYEKKAGLTLKLRAASVDTAEPLELEDLQMWLMLAEVGQMRLWYENPFTKQRVHLWSYEAPWFVAEEQQELMDLYKK